MAMLLVMAARLRIYMYMCIYYTVLISLMLGVILILTR